MKKTSTILVAFLFIMVLFSQKVFSQINTLNFKKELKEVGCSECSLEKKTKKCFIVLSYVGNVKVSTSLKEGAKQLEESKYDKTNKTHEAIFCVAEKYQEVTITAQDFAPLTISLTPYDFGKGVPVITIFDAKESSPLGEDKDVFEKMADLEKESQVLEKTAENTVSTPTKAAEKPILMLKRSQESVCDYCAEEGKKYSCFMIISSLKGGKLMNGEERILHKKAFKVQDSTRMYVFCLKSAEYQQYLFKAKGYQNGVVEVIPNDFKNGRTPVLTFYSEDQRAIYEKNANKMYAQKHPERWLNNPCGNNPCVYIYSPSQEVVINDDKQILKPTDVSVTSSGLNKFTYCVNPQTKTLMASIEGYEPCLLKLKFEDLEAVGATTFVVSTNEGDLLSLSKGIESDNEPAPTPVSVPEPTIATTSHTKAATSHTKTAASHAEGTEYRIQLVAKVLGDYNSETIKKEFNVSYEVKEDYDGAWHRFTFGSYKTAEEAKKILSEYKNKQLTTDAFIVVYKNGKRVGLLDDLENKK